MPNPRWIKLIVFASGVIWLGLLVLQGASVDVTWLRSLGGVAGVLVVGVFLFDRYAWRWPGVRRFTTRRVLHGTWKGELVSTWIDPDTHKPRPPIECYLVVHQTYSEISATLLTAESTSRSITCAVQDPTAGQCLLTAIYQNVPDLLVQDRSRIHRGGILLEIADSPPTSLKGFYWTDRDTKGQIEFEAHVTETAGRFETARTLFP